MRQANPYRQRAMAPAQDASSSMWGIRAPAEPIPEPTGLHSIDLQAMATRNYRVGLEAGRHELIARLAELEEENVTAWDKGFGAGEDFADERASQQCEAILRLARVRLRPIPATRKPSDPAAAMAQRIQHVEDILDGALCILGDDMRTVDEEDAAEATGMTVKGFAQLELVLLQAAAREESHDDGLEDDEDA